MNSERLRHSLPYTISALLICFAPHITSKPLWITMLLLASAATRYLTMLRNLNLPPLWVRTPLGVFCFLAVLYAYGGVNGVQPGSALLAVMAAMKILETKNDRDQIVLCFICLFLILSTFLLEQTIWSIVYLIMAFFMTMTAWSAVTRESAPRGSRWYTKESISMLVMAAPLLAVMWIVFPRVPGPFWAIPTQKGNTTGLSSTLSPGDISNLSESDEVAFRVRFLDTPPSQSQLYWRAIVMQRFDGRSWRAEEPTLVSRVSAEINLQRTISRYTITAEPTQQRWLYALDLPTEWQGEFIYMSRFLTLERSRPINARFSYQVQSHLGANASKNMPKRAQDWYLNLPSEGNARAREFATSLRAASTSDQAFVRSVLQHFREQPFYYTLSPPGLGRDSVDEFLFSTRRGFCEHYASSFAFLMRAAGIPARIVAGYQGGERNPLSDYWIVRQSDAHAWTEVWLEGVGWQRVDPTAAVAPERIEQNLESALLESGEFTRGAFDLPMLERLQLLWDMANAKWNDWVLGFGPETQKRFFEWLGLDDPDWRDLVIILSILLVFLMSAITLWLTWIHRPTPPDSEMKQFIRLQKKLGLPAEPNETPSDYAKRAIAANPALQTKIETAIWHYLRARYAEDQTAAERLPSLVNGIRKAA
ncbi:MAG: DUF3488 and transglutaminase-like domain-containing protein [Pseudomonadota bacterium]